MSRRLTGRDLGLDFKNFIHEAATLQSADLLSKLIEDNGYGSIHSLDHERKTPLHRAASAGSLACVKLLLRSAANPNAQSGIEDQVSTPLHLAISNGHYDCVVELLQYEVNMDVKNSCGQTPADLARIVGQNKILSHIKHVQAQRQKAIEDQKGKDLYSEVSEGNFEKAKALLDSLLEPQKTINSFFGKQRTNTLLFKASLKGYTNIVQLLIDYGADGRSNGSENGFTPMYAACYRGHLEVVQLLSMRFPKHLIMPSQLDETYPIHAVVNEGHPEIVKFLIGLRNLGVYDGTPRRGVEEQYYVDINKRNKDGYTPLHLAVLYGHHKIVSLLLSCRPYTTEEDEERHPGSLAIDKVQDNKSAFHFALINSMSHNNSLQCAELLLKAKCNRDQLLDDGQSLFTPLCYVSTYGKIELVRLLLKYGVTDKFGAALKGAMAADHSDVVKDLLASGVLVDESGELILAAVETELQLKPIFLNWKGRFIPEMKDTWLVQSAYLLDTNNILQNSLSLTLKVFTHIDLSENYLTKVPLVLFQLPSLSHLNLSENKIKEFPVGEDVSDPFIFISNEDEGLTGTQQWNCPSLKVLDVSKNLLTSIPKKVFDMPSLESLDCSNNQLDRLPYDMWLAKSLRIIVANDNNLCQLPFHPTQASINRQTARNSRVPSAAAIENNKANKKDNAAGMPLLCSIRPTWHVDDQSSDDDSDGEDDVFAPSPDNRFVGLQILELNNNEFTMVPVGLACLTPNLSKLLINNNHITEVTQVSAFPEHLTHIDLSSNKIEVFDFKQAHSVCAHTMENIREEDGKRACVHQKHYTLHKLSNLNLSHNGLQHLDLYSNNLSHNGLQHLDLYSNKPTHEKSPPTKKQVFCKNLKTLDLSHNKFTQVPKGIGNLTSMGSFFFTQNPGTKCLPYELGLCVDLFVLKVDSIALQDLQSIIVEKFREEKEVKPLIRHLKSLHDKAEPFPNLKLMLMGQHGIGKTTLLRQLRKQGTGAFQSTNYQPHFNDRLSLANENTGAVEHDNLSTVGVDICTWEYGSPKPIKFSTWDFAGQKEYYATHQCFLTQRAIYLLVWNIEHGEKGIDELEQWLLNIQARVSDTSVIIVGTHTDRIVDSAKLVEYSDLIHHRFISLTRGGGVTDIHTRGLPNVVASVQVSCVKNDNIDFLRTLLYNTASILRMKGRNASKEPIIDQKVPASYLAVDKAVSSIVQKLGNDVPVLDKKLFRSKVYKELAFQPYKLKNGDEELDQAIQFLHDYGTLVHFTAPTLDDLYFVRPQWLCDMLAQVVSIKSVNPCIHNGVLKVHELQHQILRCDTAMLHKYIDLLNIFEVAIKISEKYLLIPSLLPENQCESTLVAEHDSPEMRKAMNMQIYLRCGVVFRRQYLMAYVPSGLWSRLHTRLIADERVCKIVSECCVIHGSNSTPMESGGLDTKTLMSTTPPAWACWKNGMELSYFQMKLLRVCQLPDDLPFHGSTSTTEKRYLLNASENKTLRKCIEIVAPSVSLNFDKFYEPDPGTNENLKGFRFAGVNYDSQKTACRLLVLVVEHIETLLAEWYTNLDTADMEGNKAVERVSFCYRCLNAAMHSQHAVANVQQRNYVGAQVLEHTSQVHLFPREDSSSDEGFEDAPLDHAHVADQIDGNFLPDAEFSEIECEQLNESRKRVPPESIVAFSIEQACGDLSRLICPFHKIINPRYVFPDLCFLDTENSVVDNSAYTRGDILGSGAYGKVYRSEIIRDGQNYPAAMKIPTNVASSEQLVAYQNYKNIRQEIGILLEIQDPNIVSLLGVSFTPFAMFLDLAPQGCLMNILEEYKSKGKLLSSLLITKSLQQIASALKYLHGKNHIYRDLKAENILVWSFPQPDEDQSREIKLALTDFGISRSVAIGGNKGLQGTPTHIAPEILIHSGAESYSDKVDCFSFGSLMYELIALKAPFYGVQQYKVRQNMIEGERAKLPLYSKRYPVCMLPLLYKCWAHSPFERPTSAEIVNITSLPEFLNLQDVLGFRVGFKYHAMITSNPVHCSPSVPSSRVVVGSNMWLCGKQQRKKGEENNVLTVFAYRDYKYQHLTNIRLKERVLAACSIGSTVWLGNKSGSVCVYCSLSYKLIAEGQCHKKDGAYITNIIHSPVCKMVVITFNDGSAVTCKDDLPNNSLGFSEPFTYTSPIHSVVVVACHLQAPHVTMRDGEGHMVAVSCSTSRKQLTYELWLGQEEGRVAIVDLKTMQQTHLFNVEHRNSSKLAVILLETERRYESTDICSSTDNLWLAAYPMTRVLRIDTQTRTVKATFDVANFPQARELNSTKSSKKFKATKLSDSLIQSLSVVEGVMYVGTSNGRLFTCDALSLVVLTQVKCYQEFIPSILPFTMWCHGNKTTKKHMLLTCGARCLHQWLPSKHVASKDLTLLTWSANNL